MLLYIFITCQRILRIKFYFVARILVVITSYFCNIKSLSRANFRNWKEEIDIKLSYKDLDYTLKESKPTNTTFERNKKQKVLYGK